MKDAREVGYHSRFGGLWIDRTDALENLAHRLISKDIDCTLFENLLFFREKGYVILRQAVDSTAIDIFLNTVDSQYRSLDPRLKISTLQGTVGVDSVHRMQPVNKLLDHYAISEASLPLMFAPPIQRFLSTLFDDEVLAFQSLNFEVGSTQTMHQDTFYVVVESPLELAACWVALEDIAENTGELIYYPGSHRISDFVFGCPERKHWEPVTDGAHIHDVALHELHSRCIGMGLSVQSFRPKKGDCLIWAADLVHGGATNVQPNTTRRSYVTHYTPLHNDPHYLRSKSNPKKRQIAPGCHIASMYYDI